MGRSNLKIKKFAWNSSSWSSSFIKNATIGLHETQLHVKFKKKKKNCVELEFMELEFQKKRHYKAPYGAIKLKKTCMF